MIEESSDETEPATRRIDSHYQKGDGLYFRTRYSGSNMQTVFICLFLHDSHLSGPKLGG